MELVVFNLGNRALLSNKRQSTLQLFLDMPRGTNIFAAGFLTSFYLIFPSALKNNVPLTLSFKLATLASHQKHFYQIFGSVIVYKLHYGRLQSQPQRVGVCSMALCRVYGENVRIAGPNSQQSCDCNRDTGYSRKKGPCQGGFIADCSQCLPLVRIEELAVGEGPGGGRMGKREKLPCSPSGIPGQS